MVCIVCTEDTGNHTLNLAHHFHTAPEGFSANNIPCETVINIEVGVMKPQLS